MTNIKKAIDKVYSFIEPLFKEPKKHLKTWLVIIGVLVASWAIVFFLRTPEVAEASWWNETWLYRRAIQINNDNGEDLTDFQVAITLDTASLVSDGKMQADCDDLRITDQNGQILPHWIEENNPGCNNAATKVWVKVPTVHKGANATTVYAYYGNSQAENGENGDNVFEFFDDFSGDILDTNKWTKEIRGSGGSISVSNGEALLSPTPNTISSANLKSLSTFTNNIIIELRRKQATNTSYLDFSLASGSIVDTSGGTSSWWHTSAQSGYCWFYQPSTSDGIRRMPSSGNSVTLDSGALDINTSSYAVHKMTYGSAGELLWVIDDIQKRSATDTNFLSNEKFILISQGEYTNGAGDTQHVDYVFVRQYAATELTAGAPAAEEISPGPVAYWKFDEGTGTTAHDSSGQGNDGTISGASWQSEDLCVSGKCLRFGGVTDDLIDYGQQSSLKHENNSFSISAWIKLQSTSTQYIVNDLDRGNGTGYGIVVATDSCGSSAKLAFIVQDGRTGWLYNCSGLSNPQTNTWYHAVGVYNTTNNTSKFYIDGELVSSVSLPSDYAKSSRNFRIGRAAYYNGSFFNGFIDEVKIYPYARTEEQIKSDYAAGLAGIGSTKGSSAIMGSSGFASALNDGLVGYWNFDVGVGTTVPDLSGNDNTGTLGVGDSAPSWSSGKYGTGSTFNNSTSYIQITNPINFPTTEISTAFWIKSSDSGDGIISYEKGSNEWLIYQSNDLSIYRNSFIRTGIAINDGLWHHVVATWKSAGGETNLYVDGESRYQGVLAPGTTIDNSDGCLIFGQDQDSVCGGFQSGQAFGGTLDEVRIYNRALSAAEVKALYEWAPGPVAHYTFDDSSDSSGVADISGYGNNGTWSGSSTNRYSTGKYGSAGVFNGSNQNISVADSSDLRLTSGGTIEAWIKPNGYGWILEKYWGTIGYEIHYGFSSASQQIIFTAGGEGTYTNTEITNGEWNHVAVTFTSTGRKIYINGVDKTWTGGDNTALPTSSGGLNIGSRGPYSPSNYFNGLIDDVRIYNYARTQKQILEDMEGGAPGAARMPQPIAYWKFDEGYGTTAHDSIGSNHGTLGAGDSAPSWTNEGKIGKALAFNGSSDFVDLTNNFSQYIQAPTETPAENMPSFSLSVWAKRTANGHSSKIIFGKYGYNAGILEGQFGLWSNTSTFYSIPYSVPLNTWYMATMTYDQQTQIAKGYIDSQYVGFINMSGLTFKANEKNLRAGGEGVWFFNGLIDEVKIYNYALSEDEIKQDYNQGMAAVMGQSSSSTGSSAPAGSAAQEYCVPGSTDYCAPPVAEWNFEENTGNTARDTSGNGNDGTLGIGDSAPLWSVGYNSSGASLKFDGNDYVNTTDISTIELSDTTISFWGKVNNINKDNDFITKGAHNTNQPLLIWFDSVVGAGGDKGTGNTNTISVITYDGSTQHWVAAPTNTINDTNWHFYSIVINPTNNKIKIWVDGLLVEQNTKSWNGIRDTATALRFGNPTPSSSTAGLDGLIDQVRIYDYARTPAQIAWDYNRGAPVGHWRFDECEGTTAHDVSGNENHGTINIGTTGTQTAAGTCALSNSTYAWRQEQSTRILRLDGVDDWINLTIETPIDVKTLSFQIKIPEDNQLNYLYNYVFDLRTDGTAYLNLRPGGSFQYTNIDKMYVNGKEITINQSNLPRNQWFELTVILDSNQLITNNITLFTRYSISERQLQADINNVRIYNYALTDEQVKLLYNEGAVSFR